MTRISELPAKERVKRYSRLAFEAKRDAELAKGQERESFLVMASQWQKLAELAAQDVEREEKG